MGQKPCSAIQAGGLRQRASSATYTAPSPLSRKDTIAPAPGAASASRAGSCRHERLGSPASASGSSDTRSAASVYGGSPTRKPPSCRASGAPEAEGPSPLAASCTTVRASRRFGRPSSAPPPPPPARGSGGASACGPSATCRKRSVPKRALRLLPTAMSRSRPPGQPSSVGAQPPGGASGGGGASAPAAAGAARRGGVRSAEGLAGEAPGLGEGSSAAA